MNIFSSVFFIASLIAAALPGAMAQDRFHDKHSHGNELHLPSGPDTPSVRATIKADPAGGYNLHVMVKNFRFAPENASGKHVAGEGHGHIYVNGEKIARLYGEWFHIQKLPEDGAIVGVTLNANDHRNIIVDGKKVASNVRVGKGAIPTKQKVHRH